MVDDEQIEAYSKFPRLQKLSLHNGTVTYNPRRPNWELIIEWSLLLAASYDAKNDDT